MQRGEIQHSGIWVTLDLNSPMLIPNLLASKIERDWVPGETEVGKVKVEDNRWLDKSSYSGQSGGWTMGCFLNLNMIFSKAQTFYPNYVFLFQRSKKKKKQNSSALLCFCLKGQCGRFRIICWQECNIHNSIFIHVESPENKLSFLSESHDGK